MPTRKITPQRALVVGGGIVGLSAAIDLQRRGLATELVTASPMRGTASWGNAGHIAVEQVEPLASFATIRSFPRRLFARGGALGLPPGDIRAWLPFSLRLVGAARPRSFARGAAALSAALAEATPAWRRLLDTVAAPQLLVDSGHFIVWETPETAARNRAHWMGAPIGTARVRDASPEEIALLRALVAQPIAGAVKVEGSGQIADPDALADALERGFARLGGEIRIGHVQSLVQRADGQVVALLDHGEALEADAIVVATGAATPPLLEPLGHRVPLIAERGYHIQSAGTGWPADLPPVVFEDRSMIVTRFASGLRAASFVEFGRLASPPDPRKWARLHAHAEALGLPIGTDAVPWMGARPTFPDYLPAIGRSARANNLFYAFGHQHLGLTLGPITGEAIGALVTGQAPALDLAPFDLRRFRG
ncbi:FAD-binding oxidoreductase [Sphingomonas sp.]|uniref:NAD(P)/FAD-dependent oxidoreductase n=1 Tax=Sphingomonas sp. TaxID=28214 RepID=UPI0031D7984A